MSTATSELAHLFRALKAPAAARALPKLADRARGEEWSYEHFAAVLLKCEIDSRDSHGGQARIKAARFPARKTSRSHLHTDPGQSASPGRGHGRLPASVICASVDGRPVYSRSWAGERPRVTPAHG